MRQEREIMGMPVVVEIIGDSDRVLFEQVFNYFIKIDKLFSTYKSDSQISKLNRGEILMGQLDSEVKEVLELAEKTKQQSGGYFNIQTPQGHFDPSGLVKGWAIWKAAENLKNQGCKNFYIEAGGDIQAQRPLNFEPWKIGIKNPFNRSQIIKVLKIYNQGVATSGSYERGAHIYNPHNPAQNLENIVSVTVVAENIYDADRFATAAFAMGEKGIEFLSAQPDLAAYVVNINGIATQTSNFQTYVLAA